MRSNTSMMSKMADIEGIGNLVFSKSRFRLLIFLTVYGSIMKDLARLEELREIGKRAKVEAKDMDLESLNSNMSKGLGLYFEKFELYS